MSLGYTIVIVILLGVIAWTTTNTMLADEHAQEAKEFAEQVAHDNEFLIFERNEYKKLWQYCLDNPSQTPDFTPLDLE
jgi:hypothetical protein